MLLAFGRTLTTDGVFCPQSQGSAASYHMWKYYTVRHDCDFCYVWKDIFERMKFNDMNGIDRLEKRKQVQVQLNKELRGFFVNLTHQSSSAEALFNSW